MGEKQTARIAGAWVYSRISGGWVCLLSALLVGRLLACGVARADEPASATDTWTEEKIETAFHDVLAHGDLSDIGFLGKTLGLTFEVLEWENSSQFQKELSASSAVATAVPSYINPYDISYSLLSNTKTGTTLIRLMFQFKTCRNLGPWGKDWNLPVVTGSGMATDGGPSYQSWEIRWQADEESIVFNEVAIDSCRVDLTQNKHAALSISPPPPPATTPGAGTELVEQVIDLVAAGDLRNYLTSARILHTEMSTYGEVRAHQLYKGGARPGQLISGTHSRYFLYYANDSGWIDTSILGIYSPPRHGPRTVQVEIPVDTAANCISPESLEARMRQRHIHFRKAGQALRTFQQGNQLSISYHLWASCIWQLDLDQVTDVAHTSR